MLLKPIKNPLNTTHPPPSPPPPKGEEGQAPPSLWGEGGGGWGGGGVCLYVCVIFRNINRETVTKPPRSSSIHEPRVGTGTTGPGEAVFAIRRLKF